MDSHELVATAKRVRHRSYALHVLAMSKYHLSHTYLPVVASQVPYVAWLMVSSKDQEMLSRRHLQLCEESVCALQAWRQRSLHKSMGCHSRLSAETCTKFGSVIAIPGPVAESAQSYVGHRLHWKHREMTDSARDVVAHFTAWSVPPAGQAIREALQNASFACQV